MRLLNLLYFIILLLLLCNCKKDESEASIIGKWNPQTAVQNSYEDGEKINSTTYIASEKTFNADGSGLMKNGELYSKIFSWTLVKDTLTITVISDYGVSTTSKWEMIYLNNNSFQIKNKLTNTTTSNHEYITESIETYKN